MERKLRKILVDALSGLGIPADNIEIEVPKDALHGDFSTPVAMILSKQLKKSPKIIAEDIRSKISGSDSFESIEIAGPGFINFRFSKKFIVLQMKELISGGDSFIAENIGRGKRVQIEFVSANPTGPMHLGHGRGAAVGAALSNMLNAAGYSVEKEFYVNDAGRQVKLLGESVFARYKELLGVSYPLPEDGYRGDYVGDVAKELKNEYGEQFKSIDFDKASEAVIDFAYNRMLDAIKKDLADFGVHFDTWQSEKELYSLNKVQQALEDLRGKGFVFDNEGAVWFKSTEFGDDKDRVVVKNNGDYTYFAPDIAYHRDKILRGFDELIDIWGADHHGYVPRMQAVIQALGHPKDSLKVILVQMVSLLKAGQPVQMSKRAGEFITLREVIDDIGPDTTKFLFLTRRSDSHLEVDIEVAKAQSSENPVYYVQYAHARINSIFAKAKEEAGLSAEAFSEFDGELLNDEELVLVKKLLLYPMVFKNAVLAREPHRITYYLQELAGMFHPYYHRHKVVTDDAELTKARLALCVAVKIVLKHGLEMLGVAAPQKM
ncbi:MAG: arginine--tRNA ligase [Nitrospirae bacterium]|nr:arginine--tRNA ligase [Nitrospirota bacterium]